MEETQPELYKIEKNVLTKEKYNIFKLKDVWRNCEISCNSPGVMEIRYNGMTQWDCQMVANGPDPDMDSKVFAMGPSLDLTSTWNKDPIQREPADETNGYGLTGIARAKGKDVMDVDKGHVVLSEIVQHKGVEITTEEQEARNQEEFSTGPLSNNKLLARVKAFDRHCNMVLEGVKEMWTTELKTGNDQKKPMLATRTDSSPRCF